MENSNNNFNNEGEMPGRPVPENYFPRPVPDSLPDELRRLINKYSRENESNTPDFILSHYLMSCLEAFERATLARESWYGNSLSINNND